MPGPKYRIKLYGHTSDDPGAFIKNLAAVLGTNEEGAKEALQRVPVVIREGIEKERAQALQETLGLIRALSLVEPMDGAAGESADAPDLGPLLAQLRSEPTAKEDPWRSRILTVLAIGFGTVVLLLTAVVMYRGSGDELRPAAGVESRVGSGVAGAASESLGQTERYPDESVVQPEPKPYDGYSVDELESEIKTLKKEMKELHAQLKEEGNDLVAIYNSPHIDWEELREKKRAVLRLRNRIGQNRREIRYIERSVGAAMRRPR